MKLENFVSLGTIGEGYNARHIARVDVVTGLFFWRKREQKYISRKDFGVFWEFIDTGAFTPGVQAEKLERADTAKRWADENLGDA